VEFADFVKIKIVGQDAKTDAAQWGSKNGEVRQRALMRTIEKLEEKFSHARRDQARRDQD
jgi:hypothetical protein